MASKPARRESNRRTVATVIALALSLCARPAGAIIELPYAPAFRRVVVGFGNDVLVGESHVVNLLDGTTGALLQSFPDPDPPNAGLRVFAASIAVVGDTVVVGAAANVDPSGNPLAPGAVYVFDGASAALLRTIFDPAPDRYDPFGGAVAAFGTDILVGAPALSSLSVNPEVVYLFDGSDGSLLRTFSNPVMPARRMAFGASVTVVGGDVLVGAPADGTGNKFHGSAYLLDGATGALLHAFANPSPGSVAGFGGALAASAGRVLIGAPGTFTPGSITRGTAYLFDAATGSPLLTLANPTPSPLDFFGSSLAFLGGDLLIDAPFNDTGGQDRGAAYRFDGTTGALVNAFYLGGIGPVGVVSGHALVGNVVYDDAVPPGDHFMCDTAAVNARAGGVRPLSPPARTLTDRFGSETCTLPKEQFLCPPAEKNLEGPPANPAIHQLEYQLRCPTAPAPIAGVVAIDQFHPGGVLLDLTKKLDLLVPSGKIDLGPSPGAPPQPVPPAPPALTVDHFLCYKAKVRSVTTVVPPFPVDVRDQFFPGGYPGLGLLKVVKLCTPVDKNGEDPSAPTHVGHLVCYQTRMSPPATFTRTNASTNNLNFGAQVLTVKRAGELCVPAFVP